MLCVSRIELGKPCLNLREEDEALDCVVERRVRRKLVHRLADLIALGWCRHDGILTPFVPLSCLPVWFVRRWPN